MSAVHTHCAVKTFRLYISRVSFWRCWPAQSQVKYVSPTTSLLATRKHPLGTHGNQSVRRHLTFRWRLHPHPWHPRTCNCNGLLLSLLVHHQHLQQLQAGQTHRSSSSLHASAMLGLSPRSRSARSWAGAAAHARTLRGCRSSMSKSSSVIHTNSICIWFAIFAG